MLGRHHKKTAFLCSSSSYFQISFSKGRYLKSFGSSVVSFTYIVLVIISVLLSLLDYLVLDIICFYHGRWGFRSLTLISPNPFTSLCCPGAVIVQSFIISLSVFYKTNIIHSCAMQFILITLFFLKTFYSPCSDYFILLSFLTPTCISQNSPSHIK